jgi:two-component system nitrate/nitrite response regulator NarL
MPQRRLAAHDRPRHAVRKRHLTLIRSQSRTSVVPVGIAAGHPIVRAGLRSLLAGDDRGAVGADAASTGEAVAMATAMHRGVVLFDLTRGAFDAVTATRRIAGAANVNVLLVARSDAGERIVWALMAGARGVVLDAVEPSELASAIGQIARGGAVLTPSIARRLMTELEPTRRPADDARSPLPATGPHSWNSGT